MAAPPPGRNVVQTRACLAAVCYVTAVTLNTEGEPLGDRHSNSFPITWCRRASSSNTGRCPSDSTLDRQPSRLTGRPKKRKVRNGSLPEVGATAGGRMRHRKAIRAVAVLASLGVVSGCGSSTPTTPPALITQTVTVTPAPPEPSPSATPVATPAEPSTSSAPEVFTMPNLVGENLQLAQDKLQALGSYLMDQQDAAGLGRIQVLDTNWRVCTQKPAPGAKVPMDTMVVLAAVKLSEQCP